MAGPSLCSDSVAAEALAHSRELESPGIRLLAACAEAFRDVIAKTA